jgi:Tol biopolymer transport system component
MLPRVAAELPAPLARVARLPERAWARLAAPRRARKARLDLLAPPERDAVLALGRRLDGLVAWSSNRSGNHELYLVDLRARNARQLTHHPNVDYFARFAPDGRRLVFLRSRREAVSARVITDWDVFVVNADGTGERRVTERGFYPGWTADGQAIVFHREGRVFRHELATGRETLLLDAPREFPGVTEVGDFELGPDGRRLAFGLRGRFGGAFGLHGLFSGAVVFDLDTRALAVLTAEQACEPTWTPDGRSLLWMETGGRGGTRVMTGRPDGGERRVFMDLPGTHSHEYFPKLANDGRWLVWGASAEGHEHDRADYEIFLWEVGTPPESAVRVTHHEGNDQWPDLWIRRRQADTRRIPSSSARAAPRRVRHPPSARRSPASSDCSGLGPAARCLIVDFAHRRR